MKESNPWCFSSSTKIPIGINGKSKNVLKKSNTSYEKIKAKQPSTDFKNVGVIIDKQLCCVDIDHCIKEDGTYKPEAQDIINNFKNCYIERSVSGEGIHIFFYLTKKQYLLLESNQIQSKAVFSVASDGQHHYQVEFYYKSRTRVMIVTEDELFPSEKKNRIWVSNNTLFNFINQYLNKKDKTRSGKDFHEIIPYLIETNGDKEEAFKMFLKEKKESKSIREGRFPDKWDSKSEHTAYIPSTLQKAKNEIIQNLFRSQTGYQKSRTNQKLMFGAGFLKQLRQDRNAFKRDDNLLCSYLFLLWEANSQVINGKSSLHYFNWDAPTMMVELDEIQHVMNCTSFEKATRILDKLQTLKYLKWKGTDAIVILFLKYYPMDKNGEFDANKNHIYLPQEIFEDYFMVQEHKCEKTDLLLYLYNVSERCDPGELDKQIASFFTACFGFYYDGTRAPIKRYDVPQKELAKCLNVSESTLSVQLNKLMELHYIYKSNVGDKYDQAIIITLCDFTPWSFKKYTEESGKMLHQQKHKRIKECIKTRKGNCKFSSTMTTLNFLDKLDPTYMPEKKEEVQTV